MLYRKINLATQTGTIAQLGSVKMVDQFMEEQLAATAISSIFLKSITQATVINIIFLSSMLQEDYLLTQLTLWNCKDKNSVTSSQAVSQMRLTQSTSARIQA